MTMQGWPIESVNVDALKLDLDNVRLRVPQADETAALNYLYLLGDVDGLAHDFLRDGYLDNELPVVFERSKGEFVVLEGNRRVAALKGLLNPALVPAKESQLRRLIARYSSAETPKEIRVMVAPSIAAAQPLLARLHTGLSKKSWPRDQQATFYFAQIEGGASAASLRKLYSIPPTQLTKFLKMATVLRAVRTMKFADRDLEEYTRGPALSITSFEYAYLRSQIQDLLKLEFDSDGIFTQKKLSDAQRKGLTFILRGVRDQTISTRSENLRTGTAAHFKFMEDLQKAMGFPGGGQEPPNPGGSNPGRGPVGPTPPPGNPPGGPSDGGPDTGPEVSGPADPNAGGGKRGPNSPGTRQKLDLSGLNYDDLPAGLKRRFIELRMMNVQDIPNATFDVLRTILECTIRAYCEKLGDAVPAGNQLKGCLTHLTSHFAAASDRSMRNIISGLQNGKTADSAEYFRSAEALNSANHDPNIFVTSDHVHYAWDQMLPLLKRMINKEPSSS